MTEKNDYNKAALNARVERIGQLSDIHKDCLGRRDYWGLIAVSYEYDRCKYLHRTAAMIRTEAALIQKREETE